MGQCLYSLLALDTTPLTRWQLGCRLAGLAIGFILLAIGLTALVLQVE